MFTKGMRPFLLPFMLSYYMVNAFRNILVALLYIIPAFSHILIHVFKEVFIIYPQQTCIHIKHLFNPNNRKWTMRGSYPVSWLILSAMMLTSQFVGVYCGSYWHTILEPSGHSEVLRFALDVMLEPPRKPPDPPLRTVHFDVEQLPPDKPNKQLISVNNHLYTVRKSCAKQRGALVDRGANGGLAGNDTRILTQHPSRKVDI